MTLSVMSHSRQKAVSSYTSRSAALLAVAALVCSSAAGCTLATGDQTPGAPPKSGAGFSEAQSGGAQQGTNQVAGNVTPEWEQAKIDGLVPAPADREQLNFSAGPSAGGNGGSAPWVVVSTSSTGAGGPAVVARTSADGTTWSEPKAVTKAASSQRVVAAAARGAQVAVLLYVWKTDGNSSYVLASTTDRKKWASKTLDFDGFRPEKIAVGADGIVAVGFDSSGKVAAWTETGGAKPVVSSDSASVAIVAVAARKNRVGLVVEAAESGGSSYKTYVSSDGAASWPQTPDHVVSQGSRIVNLLANKGGFLAVGSSPVSQTLRPASWQSDGAGKWSAAKTLSAESAARLVGQDGANLTITATSQDNEGKIFAVVTGPKLAGGLIIRQPSPNKDWEALEGFAAGVTDIDNVAISASSRDTAVLHLGYGNELTHAVMRQDGKFLARPEPTGGTETTTWLDVSQAPGLHAAIVEQRTYSQQGKAWQTNSTHKYLKLISSDPEETKFTVPASIGAGRIVVAGRRDTYTLVAATAAESTSDGNTRRSINLFRRSGATGPWEKARGFSQHEGDWKITGLWLAGPNQWILTTVKSGADGPESVTWLSPDGLSWSYQAQSATTGGQHLKGACSLPDNTAYLVGSLVTSRGDRRSAAWAVRDGQWQEQTPDGLPREFGALNGCARSGNETLLHGRGLSSDVVWSTPDGVSLSESWRGKPGERLESVQVLTDGTALAAGTALQDGSLIPAVWVRKPGQAWKSYRVPSAGPASAVTLVPSGGNLWVCVQSGTVLQLWKMSNAQEVLDVPLLALI